MKKNHLLSIAIGAIILGFVGFKVYTHFNPDAVPELKEIETQQESVSTKSNDTKGETPIVESKQSESVNIKVNPPFGGTLKGVIEVGASGFNAFVINIDKDKNWELISKTFGESLAIEGMTSTDEINSQVKKFAGILFEKGVKSNNIHFAISSGALKNPKIVQIASDLQKKYVVNKVTADAEGRYAYLAAMPKGYEDKSFVVDIGSGNGKINWMENGVIKSIETSGAKYYQQNKQDADVYAEVKAAASKVPVNLRQYCFIIGGVPSNLAKEVRNGEERFTKLKNPTEYSAGDNVKLKSGINIYSAIKDATNCNNFIFDWDANFTIGLLVNYN